MSHVIKRAFLHGTGMGPVIFVLLLAGSLGPETLFGAREPSPSAEYRTPQAVPAGMPRLLWFPPDPPILGTWVPTEEPFSSALYIEVVPGSDRLAALTTTRVHTPQLAAPLAAVRYVGEPFYAPLTSVMVRQPGETGMPGLPAPEAALLEALQRGRADLLAELRNVLNELPADDPVARLAKLETLAAAQSDRLDALERRADEFRATLVLLCDWNDRRAWHLGQPPLDGPLDRLQAYEIELLRGIAFYEIGLLPAQRRLLREMAMELESASGSNPVFGLLPEMARAPVPDETGPALLIALESFRKEKAALQQELLATVLETEKMATPAERRTAFRALAARQGPRLNTLEQLAEEARRTIAAGHVVRHAEPAAPFPDELRARINDYIRTATAYRMKRREALEPRKQFEASKLPRKERPSDSVATANKLRKQRYDKIDAIGQALEAEYDAAHADEVAEFDRRNQELRIALQPYAPAESLAVLSSDPVHHFTDFFRHRHQRQLYMEYEIAMLEPGLSPAQRRLLLSGIMTDLRPPRPRATWQPLVAPKKRPK